MTLPSVNYLRREKKCCCCIYRSHRRLIITHARARTRVNANAAFSCERFIAWRSCFIAVDWGCNKSLSPAEIERRPTAKKMKYELIKDVFQIVILGNVSDSLIVCYLCAGLSCFQEKETKNNRSPFVRPVRFWPWENEPVKRIKSLQEVVSVLARSHIRE